MVKADTNYHPKKRMTDADDSATMYFLCKTHCISTCAAQERDSTMTNVTNKILYILESNPHPFYSFRGLKNQMRIRFVVVSWILEK